MDVTLQAADLSLYVLQQLGMMLGVGGACVLLVGHLVSLKSPTSDKNSSRFFRSIRSVGWAGLTLVILSGAAITFLHLFLGQGDIVAQPVFLFKWSLIFLVTILSLAEEMRRTTHSFLTGFLGGSWLALFILHVLAPIASWVSLGALYGTWMLLFMLIWSTVVYAKGKIRSHQSYETSQAAPELAPLVQPIPEPVAKPSLVQPIPVPEPVVSPPVALVPTPAPAAPVPIVTPPVTQTVVFTDLTAGESYPLRDMSKGDSPMLHPHLTDDTLPTQPHSEAGDPGLQSRSENVTVPALRVMPRTPEELAEHGDVRR